MMVNYRYSFPYIVLLWALLYYYMLYLLSSTTIMDTTATHDTGGFRINNCSYSDSKWGGFSESTVGSIVTMAQAIHKVAAACMVYRNVRHVP